MVTTIKPKKLEEKPLTPQFINPTTPNKTGYGVQTPEGKSITGLTADQAFSLQTGYKKPKLTEEQQIAEDYARNQKAQAYAESQQPAVEPLLNPNQNAQLEQSLTGTINVAGEQTTKDINAMNTAAAASKQDLMGILPLNKFSGTVVKLVNKVTGGAGSDLLNLAPDVLKNYLNDYSNDDSFEIIKERTGNAKEGVNYAISLSRDPTRAVDAAETFESSIKSMRIAQAQLKLITQRKGYNKDVDKQLEEINFYLEKIAPNELRTLQLNIAMGGR